MKENIGTQTEHIYLDRGFSLGSESKYKERYISIMDEIQAEADRKFQEQTTDTIAQFLSEGDSWAETLYDYVRNNYRMVANQTGFLTKLNIESLILKLNESKSFDWHAFRSCILQLYSTPPIGAALSQDKPRLIDLKKGIEEMDKSSLDKIQRTHAQYLILNLDQAIALYNQNE